MCGITGIWRFDGKPIDPVGLTKFNDALLHRGPDSGDIFIDGKHNLGLGHRRLSIHDLSQNGAQPMTFQDRYAISFNGEIYNYRELRSELEEMGFHFFSDSDTEVALYAYAQWGVECFKRFNGMWAMALWDSFEGKLRICIDRFAIKSCLYYRDSAQFAFASELKAFALLPDADLQQNVELINSAFVGQANELSQTLFSKAKRIPAGHYLEVDSSGDISMKRWWNTLLHLPEAPNTFEEQVEQLQELMTDSVRLRLSTDTKYGIPISGGMDSSSIMLTARDVLGDDKKPLDGFVINKQGLLDETDLAKEVCHRAGAVLTEVNSSPYQDADMLEKLTICYENIDPASEGPYLLYRSMRQQSRVVSLDGHGMDELMAGYAYHIAPALDDAFSGVPNLAKIFDLSVLSRNMSLNIDSLKPWDGWQNTKRFLRGAFKGRFSAKHNPNSYTHDQEWYPDHFDYLNTALYHDVHYGFLQNILRAFDYASMAHGVEARTPFLDWRLVTFLFSLPSDSKLKHGYTKRLLRHAMAGKLPDSVRLKKNKIGFIDTKNYFYNPNTLAWARDKLDSHTARNSNLWDHKEVMTIVDKLAKQQTSHPAHFSIVMRMARLVHLTESFAAGQRSLRVNDNIAAIKPASEVGFKPKTSQIAQ
ncbi:asparagine synthase (glutamine-hydrolyzing) [Pseudoalteromonas byunsanensis]|uniref:asparagine synthase (glutamine-hydrolyzing) n=1 Tax=Pseudoalteromonas byunsanensis TaxID=327939 RepID=A0A1S1NBL0_9GAMM|nr:asparagine synthase (glutamine-hydrolyzing) [Pseudoalteromonas byunsanensis]OHU96933.1 asparagine synthase (glutamine-hydrolyzing) [Pseudoalteromonas byunsanensis]